MNQEQKRIKIAEACGWERDDLCDCWRKPSEGPYATAFLNRSINHRQLPDYFSDLNACHEMEKVLKDDSVLWHRYASWIDDNYVNQPYTIGATAAQRAEAFGKTLNLW